jgi:UDP-xylose/UDP-N-acetylglucosamine transporter B4
MDRGIVAGLIESSAGEWLMIISLVFGGCCSFVVHFGTSTKSLTNDRNVWALEAVLKDFPNAGQLTHSG